MIKSIDSLTLQDVAGICDHTYLNRPEAFAGKADNPIGAWRGDFDKFLQKTAELPFVPYGICVRHDTVDKVRKFLGENKYGVQIVATAGFPYGDCSYNTKMGEVKIALENGADEVDIVMNQSMLGDGENGNLYEELSIFSRVLRSYGVVSKIILETSELNASQIKTACQIADDAGFDFVKTSTGFSSCGARDYDLRNMVSSFPRGIKMSGGVNKNNYKSLLRAASGRDDGMIDLDPMKIRIGESKLISSLMGESGKGY